MNVISEIISKVTKDLIEKQNKLLFDRICERVKTDEPIDLTKEAQRRFPRICAIKHDFDDSIHYYWNDGSVDGLHLISFYPDNDLSLNKENRDNYSITFHYK